MLTLFARAANLRTRLSLFAFLAVFPTSLIASGASWLQPVPVADINPQGNAYPSLPAAIGSELYFVADNGQNFQLFRTDGTTTVQASSVYSTTRGIGCIDRYSTPHPIGPIGVGQYVLFGVDTGQLCSPEEMWATQGTAESAKLVKVFDGPIVSWQVVGDVAYVVAANGMLYDVWRTDGTAGGTTLVKDGFSLEWTTPTAVLDSAFYLAAAHSDTGGQFHLWRVDGGGAKPLAVTGGEFRTLHAYQDALYISVGNKVLRLPSGSDTAVPLKPSQLSVDVPQMRTVGERLYLLQLERTGSERRETWWRYDGASDVLDRIGVWSRVIGLTHLGDSDYFVGFPLGSRFTGGELLRLPLASTAPTTVSPQFSAGGTNNIGAIATDGERLYLLVNPQMIEYTGPTDLWISDGSAGGTRPFTSLVTSYADMRYEGCPCVTAAGNQVFFDRQTAQTGVELWRSAESTNLEYLPLITHR